MDLTRASLDRSNNPRIDEKLLQPYLYVTGTPRNETIHNMIVAFNQWLSIPEKYRCQIEEIAYMVYNAVLLFEDLHENATVKKGAPSAHAIYGVPATINAANYILHLVLEKVMGFQKPEAIELYQQQMIEVQKGQGMYVYHQENMEVPTEEQYNEMAIQRIGGFYKLLINLMHTFSSSKKKFVKLLELIGLLLQIIEDQKKLLSEKNFVKSGAAENLVQIKYSIPIIYAISSTNGKDYLIPILKQKKQSVEVKEYCIELLKRYKCFEYAEKKIINLQSQIRVAIAQLGGNVILEELLDGLVGDASWPKK